MGDLWFREPTAGDLLQLCEAMNEADAREIFALRRHESRVRLAMEIYTALPQAYYARAVGLDRQSTATAFLGLWRMDESGGLLAANLFATEEFPSLGYRLARFVRKTLIPELLRAGVRRVEARASAAHTKARVFLKACGAVEEAELPDLGQNGETYILCAWRRRDFQHVLHAKTDAAARPRHQS